MSSTLQINLLAEYEPTCNVVSAMLDSPAVDRNEGASEDALDAYSRLSLIHI